MLRAGFDCQLLPAEMIVKILLEILEVYAEDSMCFLEVTNKCPKLDRIPDKNQVLKYLIWFGTQEVRQQYRVWI